MQETNNNRVYSKSATERGYATTFQPGKRIGMTRPKHRSHGKKHKISYISRSIVHKNSYKLSKIVMSSKFPSKMPSFMMKNNTCILRHTCSILHSHILWVHHKCFRNLLNVFHDVEELHIDH